MSWLIALALYCALGVELAVRAQHGEPFSVTRDKLHAELRAAHPDNRLLPGRLTRAITNIAVALGVLAFVLLWLPCMVWSFLQRGE